MQGTERIMKKRNASPLNFDGSFALGATVRIHTFYPRAYQVDTEESNLRDKATGV
jgi:hypothetical protein